MIRAHRLVRALLLVLALAPPALAQETIVSGLSQSRVSITADFDGSEILIYGAVKRDTPAPEGGPLEVIVTVEGPSTPVTVRRKDRVAGIWVNNAEVVVDSAPSFYAVATTGPLEPYPVGHRKPAAWHHDRTGDPGCRHHGRGRAVGRIPSGIAAGADR